MVGTCATAPTILETCSVMNPCSSRSSDNRRVRAWGPRFLAWWSTCDGAGATARRWDPPLLRRGNLTVGRPRSEGRRSSAAPPGLVGIGAGEQPPGGKRVLHPTGSVYGELRRIRVHRRRADRPGTSDSHRGTTEWLAKL